MLPPRSKGRGGPHGSRPNVRVPARTNVTSIIGDAGDIGPAGTSTAPCPACGHDPGAAFRDRLKDREDAWRAGQRVGREAVRDTEITAYWDGWEHGHRSGIEEGRWTA